MTVSKRTRFEVLRRDGFQCYYCHLQGPADGSGLTIDHVVPVALGGDDSASNLVAACRDCNAGKTSTRPDSDLIEGVSESHADFRRGLRAALAASSEELRRQEETFGRFLELWDEHCPTFRASYCYPPQDAKVTVAKWLDMGVTFDILNHALEIAFARSEVAYSAKFRYAAGVVWNIIKQAEPVAAPTEDEDEKFMRVLELGIEDERGRQERRDLLRHHIDGTTNLFVRAFTGPKAAA